MDTMESRIECDLEKGHNPHTDLLTSTATNHASTTEAITNHQAASQQLTCRASIDIVRTRAPHPTGHAHVKRSANMNLGARSSIDFDRVDTTRKDHSRATVDDQDDTPRHYFPSFVRDDLLNSGTITSDSKKASWAFQHHKSNLLQSIKKRKATSFPRIRFRSAQRGKDRDIDCVRKYYQRPDEENDYRINFAELQRMRLRKLQCRLVKHVRQMIQRDEEPENWEHDLKTYIEAVRDYDYMTIRCKVPRDPFLVTGERYIDSFVIQDILGDVIKDKKKKKGGPPTLLVDGPWENDEQPIGGTRNKSIKKRQRAQFQERIFIAAVAGSFLIGPMWLMVLDNTTYTCLVSTTVFVTVFGLILAWSLDSAKEVMSGTAAYAAVLVVFVGLGQT